MRLETTLSLTAKEKTENLPIKKAQVEVEISLAKLCCLKRLKKVLCMGQKVVEILVLTFQS